MTMTDIKNFATGKTITDIHLDESEQCLTIKFEDGFSIVVKAHGQYCDDVWLELEVEITEPRGMVGETDVSPGA